MKKERVRSIARKAVLVFGLAFGVGTAWAQVDCANNPSPVHDFDGDGFMDKDECDGIALLNGATFNGFRNRGTTDRTNYLDPNSADLFVIIERAANGHLPGTASFPGALSDLFAARTHHNVSFNGLVGLGIAVHVLEDNPTNPVFPERLIGLILGTPTTIPQKAVKLAESVSPTATVMGKCQWGTPNGEDGCVVYTQKIKNFIASTSTAANDTTTDQNAVFRAYVTETVLHEVAHTSGGITAELNSKFGGPHYKPGAGVIMEQSVNYSCKNNKCTWFISSGWNATLDPPAVRLK